MQIFSFPTESIKRHWKTITCIFMFFLLQSVSGILLIDGRYFIVCPLQLEILGFKLDVLLSTIVSMSCMILLKLSGYQHFPNQFHCIKGDELHRLITVNKHMKQIRKRPNWLWENEGWKSWLLSRLSGM